MMMNGKKYFDKRNPKGEHSQLTGIMRMLHRHPSHKRLNVAATQRAALCLSHLYVKCASRPSRQDKERACISAPQ